MSAGCDYEFSAEESTGVETECLEYFTSFFDPVKLLVHWMSSVVTSWEETIWAVVQAGVRSHASPEQTKNIGIFSQHKHNLCPPPGLFTKFGSLWLCPSLKNESEVQGSHIILTHWRRSRICHGGTSAKGIGVRYREVAALLKWSRRRWTWTPDWTTDSVYTHVLISSIKKCVYDAALQILKWPST